MAASSRYLLLLLLFFFFFFVALLVETVAEESAAFAFSIQRFEKNGSLDSEIALSGDAEIRDSVARIGSSGRIMLRKPVKFVGGNPGFSTYFSVSPGKGGGLAFSVLPSVISVEFVASMTGSGNSPDGILTKISVGGKVSAKRIDFLVAQKLHCWIDYDGVTKMLQVRLSKSEDSRPITSFISYPIDLSTTLSREAMFVGISSANGASGNFTHPTSIYSWTFLVKHGGKFLMHSEPLDPRSFLAKSNEERPIHPNINCSWRINMSMVAGAAAGALVALAVIFLRSAVGKRHPVAPEECPVHSLENGPEKIVLVGDDLKVKVLAGDDSGIVAV